jgi:branched-chain amino acid transport system ATP-binding protein
LLERRQQLAGSMSGGEQQMLAIGRALMTCPTILIVDEPSVGLSPALVMRTIEMIGGLKEKLGLTVLMAEQNFEQTIRIANRGYVMVHGEIALTADRPEELINSDLVRKLYLGFDDQDLFGPDVP